MYRDIHTFLHACINSYIKASPSHYPINHRQWENDIHSFIHSGYFFSASLNPLLGYSEALSNTAIDTVSKFTRRSATCNCKWRTCPRSMSWRLEWDSNPRPSGAKASTQPMCHHAPRILIGNCKKTI